MTQTTTGRDRLLTFNGINGATGAYGLPPMTGAQLAAFISKQGKPENLKELRRRHEMQTEVNLGVKEGVDPRRLDEAGWGVIFAHDADPAVKEALSDLIDLRREQAGERFRLYAAGDAYRRGQDSKASFLARRGVGSGPADPDKVPYYLLIAGDPEAIPFRFQNELDVQYAVGRIHFDTLQEYANYAASVVAAEKGQVQLPRRATFFSVANPGDGATRMSTELLMEPLCQTFSARAADWQVSSVMRDAALKARLRDLLGGPETPALLMTASHGMEFPLNHPRQLPHQGALLCQDWPGAAEWGPQAIPQDHYLAGDDLPPEGSLLGLLAFFFACYGAGTPQLDEFSRWAFQDRTAIAANPFVAQLPKKMLGHPRGGALAVIGHVERAWSFSFDSPVAGPQRTVFESTLERLLAGYPVGSAVEYFNERWAEEATVLSDTLDDIEFGKQIDPYDLADMWTSNNDARGYAIAGDPAVRLPVVNTGTAAQARPAIIEVRVIPEPAAPPATAPEAPMTVVAEAAVKVTPAQNLAPASPAAPAPLPDALAPAAGETLKELTVSTYAARDMASPDQVQLKARTRISLTGDVETVLPVPLGEGDAPYLEMHRALVKEALEARLAYLKLVAGLSGAKGD